MAGTRSVWNGGCAKAARGTLEWIHEALLQKTNVGMKVDTNVGDNTLPFFSLRESTMHRRFHVKERTAPQTYSTDTSRLAQAQWKTIAGKVSTSRA
jgi:hypothetical protein